MKNAPFRRTLITLLTVAFAALALPATALAQQPSRSTVRPVATQLRTASKPKLRVPRRPASTKASTPKLRLPRRMPAIKAPPQLRFPRFPTIATPPQTRRPSTKARPQLRYPRFPARVVVPRLKVPKWAAPNAQPPVIPAKIPNLLPPNLLPPGWSR